MDNTLGELMVGIFIGMVLATGVIEFRDSRPGGWRGMKERCEATIPRNQQCVMRWEPAPRAGEQEGS